MPTDYFSYRKNAIKDLPRETGVYVLCDLDQVPIYVGQSRDGIRQRVSRHLTSARSDIIANRQIDVWEIAYVMAYPVEGRDSINELESRLYHHFNAQSQLMNGSIPPVVVPGPIPNPFLTIQVMHSDEIYEKLDPKNRLTRQANHYANLVDHFLTVKNSVEIARAMSAHFERLERYHRLLLRSSVADEEEA